MSKKLVRWCLRHLWLLLLPCVVLPFLSQQTPAQKTPSLVASNIGNGAGAIMPQTVSVQVPQQNQLAHTPTPIPHGTQPQSLGAGQTNDGATTPSDTCFADPTCWLQKAVASLAQWMAQGTLNLIQPLTDRINQGSLNFITHTPVDGTYNNGLVKTFVAFSLGVVDAALAVLIVIAGYNVMIGRHIGARSHEMMELLPRIFLAVIAAHFSLTFVQWFIDLENALNLGVINFAAVSMLTNILVGLFKLDVFQDGWLLFVLLVVLAILDILVAWQMVLRLAFLTFLIALAPLGLLCFALPQTQGWGRLWMNNFVTTVFVQFFQVCILALGGMLVTALVAGTGDLNNLFAFDTDPGKPILTALTSIAIFFLTLKLPGMLREWALRGVAQQAGTASVEAAQGTAAAAADLGVRILALL